MQQVVRIVNRDKKFCSYVCVSTRAKMPTVLFVKMFSLFPITKILAKLDFLNLKILFLSVS